MPHVNNLVSVIIPVYNGSECLEATVKTILEQTYSAVEIVLINDGSSDNSEQLIKALSEEHENIVALSKENGGGASARNYGLERANGEFVAFCDQDDFWLPTKLEEQIPLFANANTALVYCGSIARYTTLNRDVTPGFEHQFRGQLFHKLVYENMFTCCTVVARKDAVLAVGGFDSERTLMGVDDWHLWLKMAREYEFDFVEKHLAIHVFHGSNYSSNEEKMHAAELVCIEKIKATMHGKFDEVDWPRVYANIHQKYAASYLHNSEYRLASQALKSAHENNASSKLWLKSVLLGFTPEVILSFMHSVKRKL